ncbi:UBX domain-containing protein 11-like [Littorina saxatilis]|uniref:UBX domain-containing protein 11 n=1 Tax=Littorina saxatilis TaxID=31220 RepID=A0AAN9AMR2_9CAEN
MSSPLSSLKKGNRTGSLPGHIQGNRRIPFRHPEYSEDESRLLEEITTSMASTRIKARDPFSTGILQMDSSPNPSMRAEGNNNSDDPPPNSDVTVHPPNDRELMKLLMARLAIMESKIQTQEQEVKTKDRRVKVLEDKLRIMSKARAVDASNSNGEVEGKDTNNSQKRVMELEQHCLLLQQQVHEMETFLADYGMVWVGDQDDPEADMYIVDNDPEDVRKEKQAEAGLQLEDADVTSSAPYAIDFERLFENIRDLNIIAGEGEQRVCHTTDGARLMRQENIPISFYANGMVMFEGPFRPYIDPATVQCMQDFLDGYFPSELQLRYPDGVPFNVRDMRSVFFKPVKAADVFSGVGMTLGGEPQPSRLVPTGLRHQQDWAQHASTSTSTVTSDLGFQPVKAEQFLNRLPKSVVKGGKVIDIRGSVGKQLSGVPLEGKQQATVVETAVTRTIQKTISEAKVDRPKTPRDITTLRIKSEKGDHTYIVKMRFSETIGDLRKYLNDHRPGNTEKFDICSTYPRQVFTDEKATMDASGLVPNGVLYLQAKK